MQYDYQNEDAESSLSRKVSFFSTHSDISEYKYQSQLFKRNTGSVISKQSFSIADMTSLVDKVDANYKLKQHLLKTLHYLMRSSIYIENRRKSRVPSFRASRRISKPNELKSLYQNIKNNATNYIITNMILKLATILNKEQSQRKVKVNILPHELFSWSRDHFIERRSLSDFLYLEILQHTYNRNQLIHLKFAKDLSELMRYCTLIHNEYFMNSGLYGPKTIEKELHNGQDLINMETKLTNDFNAFSELKMMFKHNLNGMAYRFFKNHEEKRTYNLQLESLDTKVIRSIEYRYETGLMAAEAECVIYNETMKLNALENEIIYYEELIGRAEECHNMVLGALNTFYRKYMDNFKFWSKKCDTESDLLDEEIFMLKIRITQAEENYNRMEKLLERCQEYNILHGNEDKENSFAEAEGQGTETYMRQSMIEQSNRDKETKIIVLNLHEHLKKLFK